MNEKKDWYERVQFCILFLKVNLQLKDLKIEHIDVNEPTKRYWDCNLHTQKFKPLKSNVVRTCLCAS